MSGKGSAPQVRVFSGTSNPTPQPGPTRLCNETSAVPKTIVSPVALPHPPKPHQSVALPQPSFVTLTVLILTPFCSLGTAITMMLGIVINFVGCYMVGWFMQNWETDEERRECYDDALAQGNKISEFCYAGVVLVLVLGQALGFALVWSVIISSFLIFLVLSSLFSCLKKSVECAVTLSFCHSSTCTLCSVAQVSAACNDG